MTNQTDAIISEGGNGLPDVGDYIRDGSNLYKITWLGPYIQTLQWRPNFLYAKVVPADDEDCDEDDESTCSIELDDDDDDRGSSR